MAAASGMPKCWRSWDELLPALLRGCVRSIIHPSIKCTHIQLMIKLHTCLICYKPSREKRVWRSVQCLLLCLLCSEAFSLSSTLPQDENSQLLLRNLTNKLGLYFADSILHTPFGLFYCLHGKINFFVCFAGRFLFLQQQHICSI